MSETPSNQGNSILNALLDRLYSALSRGPAINCFPGNSRQRMDLTLVEKLDDCSASEILEEILGPEERYRISPKIPAIPSQQSEEDTDEEKALRREAAEKKRVLRRISTIASEADTYLKDTGAYVLYIGYPLLSLPTQAASPGRSPARILAPLAFVPVELKVATGSRPAVQLKCSESGADRVVPNMALKIWVEKQIGIPYPDLFEDEEGTDPLREIRELTEHVCEVMEIKDCPSLDQWPVQAVPDSKNLPSEPTILCSAVLGLFQLRNQNTIADMEELKHQEELPNTVRPLLTLDNSLATEQTDAYGKEDAAEIDLLPCEEEFLVDWADPCQRRSVIRARNSKGLVVHGPPGTGKSQTITNMIGDYLARGERVLLVCEKRTALDVVKNRLDSKGLGDLCAVVHDATHDRHGLYMGLRNQLENLADAPDVADPAEELSRINREMNTLETELREYYQELYTKDPETNKDFHELTGNWLENGGIQAEVDEIKAPGDLGDISPALVMENEGELKGIYGRLEDGHYGENGWADNIGISLDHFLSQSQNHWRSVMTCCVETSHQCDKESREGLPGYTDKTPLKDQGEFREWLGDALKHLVQNSQQAIRAELTNLSLTDYQRFTGGMTSLEPMCQQVIDAPLDPNLNMVFQSAPWPAHQVAQAIPQLKEYLDKCQGIFGFLRFGIKKNASALLALLGMTLSPTNAQMALVFLEAVHARNLIRTHLEQTAPGLVAHTAEEPSLISTIKEIQHILTFTAQLTNNPLGESFLTLIWEILGEDEKCQTIASTLEGSTKQASCIESCLEAINKAELFTDRVKGGLKGKLLYGKSISRDMEKLQEDLPYLESLIRFEEEAKKFPPAIGNFMKKLSLGTVDRDSVWNRLLAEVWLGSMRRRLAQAPMLHRIDAARIENNFQRLFELTAIKQGLISDQILHQWQKKQKHRLLAGTRTRLNSDGASLRRRLMLRGKFASRIREVVHEGLKIEGGDPLFDMHPVWMSSPETACQIFPLMELFDAVIFDEASQCRLEEGLPVLARASHVVVAGDTKQLPPTRFFESAVVEATTTDDDERTEESLFQSQQSEIEDLLSACLNIEIDQTFLDIHYRSTNSELIEFSNMSFYGSRLQAIPGHPNNRPNEPAIELHHVNGIYEERTNPREAEEIVRFVKGLFRRETPPSIGIVSFNLTQRDLIEDKLQEETEKDPDFRRRLSKARNLSRKGAYEGLFVKNLENVQGDERDYIIISTTYGINTEGKFYRRFGPLGRAGGERRLNVLVTRARHKVVLMTSIPSEIYNADAEKEIPAGKRPNGAYFLMRYLHDAEVLQETYESRSQLVTSDDLDQQEEQEILPDMTYFHCETPSLFCNALGEELLTANNRGVMAYYGGEGFCMDLALMSKSKCDDVTLGVIVDGTRYDRAQDKVEWDLFRRMIFQSQGWDYRWIWSPHFLRDPQGMLNKLEKQASVLEKKHQGGDKEAAEHD